MVKIFTLDAVVADVTNTNFVQKFRLVNTLFGFQELESLTSFPARHGLSRILSMQTSDIAAAIFVILLSSFVIDRYLFKSRYLIHIGGTKKKAEKEKDVEASLEEKASLIEEEVHDIETEKHVPLDEKSVPNATPEPSSGPRPSTTQRKISWKALAMILILYLLGLEEEFGKKGAASQPKEEKPENPSIEAKEKADKTSPTSRWGKIIQHPWTRKVEDKALLFFIALFTFVTAAYHVLFWPWFLMYFIVTECAIYGRLYNTTTVPWRSITLNMTLYTTLWTIAGATILLKPNRFRGVLWNSFAWTYAIVWWLFWIIMESHLFGEILVRWAGTSVAGFTERSFMFIMRPFLFVYLYSGVVCNVVVAVRAIKHLWEEEIGAV